MRAAGLIGESARSRPAPAPNPICNSGVTCKPFTGVFQLVDQESDMNKDNSPFSKEEKRGLYRAIYERRDVRSEFLSTPLPAPVIARLLSAAHHAPSVGFMQPWDFILIENTQLRQTIKDMFTREKARAQAHYQGARAELYRSLKLEGILDCPLNICVTCDRTRGGEHVLGRNTVFETDLFSSCLAVQNLWLAARAEGVGVGWVSILDPQGLAQVLRLPDHVYPLAYLCLGYVSEFLPTPELARKGWRQRLPIEELIHRNHWGSAVEDPELTDCLRDNPNEQPS